MQRMTEFAHSLIITVIVTILVKKDALTNQTDKTQDS